ncbi:unnamed protein product [Choristocarpus tenellus]
MLCHPGLGSWNDLFGPAHVHGVTDVFGVPTIVITNLIEEGPIGVGYRSVGGGLRRVSILILLKSVCSVWALALHCVSPTLSDWKGEERVMGYLLGTRMRIDVWRYSYRYQ